MTVIIVGGGLSGLAAAHALHLRGIDVVVLEAADRIGGRTLRETSALGSPLDLGGQWVGHDHHRVRALAEQLGLHLQPMTQAGLPRIYQGPRRIGLASPAMTVAGVSLAYVQILARRRPSSPPLPETVADLLGRVPNATARRLLEVTALISWTADLDRLSVSAMAEMIRRQGGLRTMLSTAGGAQDALIAEGAGSLAERLAEPLGDRVRTSQRVEAITRHVDGAGVSVHTTDAVLRAAKVIMSVPPPVAAQIAHEPPLPAWRSHLEQTTYLGSVYKAIAVYNHPFWRPGHGDLILLDNPGAAVFDTSPAEGPGHLCFLIGGPEARSLDGLGPAERQALLLRRLAPVLGAEVEHPASWHEKAWHLDPDVGGGYIVLPEASLDEPTSPFLATPVGDVHWAGAETASDHPGYLDGAIEAGHRAAAEVTAAL